MSTYEEYERNGLEITICIDDDPESPREWDNLGTMICSHRSYRLGDEQFDADDYEGWDDLEKHLREDEDAGIILPLSLHDHSGISMSVGRSGGWDSGQVGFIYMTNEVFKENYDYAYQEEAIKQATKTLEGEVETYDQYLRGEVYGFAVINPKDDEEIDSCWDIYGLDYVKQEANSIADNFKHPHEAAYAKNASEIHGR